MNEDTTIEAARALLQWYRAMGVDAALALEPVDWLGRGDAGPGQGFRLPDMGLAPSAALPSAGGSSPGGLASRAAATHAGTPAGTPTLPGAARTPGPALSQGQRPPPSGAAAGARPGASPSGGVPRSPSAPQPDAAPRAFAAMPPDAATMAARSLAATCASLDEIAAALARFDGCALKTTAKSTCFYRGSAASRLVIVGEAPGSDEDRLGQPFVGRAGQLLDLMLKSIGLGEADVHITNIVYWRPPGNRPPTPQEAEACRPFLERQIALVQPDFVLAMGGSAAKHILAVEDGIMRIRGRWSDLTIGGRQVRAIATLHPAYLLRTPAAKRLAWRDLLQVRAALDGSADSAS